MGRGQGPAKTVIALFKDFDMSAFFSRVLIFPSTFASNVTFSELSSTPIDSGEKFYQIAVTFNWAQIHCGLVNPERFYLECVLPSC